MVKNLIYGAAIGVIVGVVCAALAALLRFQPNNFEVAAGVIGAISGVTTVMILKRNKSDNMKP